MVRSQPQVASVGHPQFRDRLTSVLEVQVQLAAFALILLHFQGLV